MNRDELEVVLKNIGWSQAELARRIKVHPVTITRWKEVPGAVVAYVRLMEEVRRAGR